MEPRDRGRVDDRAPARFLHHSRHNLHPENDTLDVNSEDPIEFVFGVVQQRSNPALDPRVVEEHIDLPELIECRLDIAADLAGDGDIGWMGRDLAASPVYRCHRLVQCRVR